MSARFREEIPPSIIIGFGNVGRELALIDEIWSLTNVIGILTSKGGIKVDGEDTIFHIRNTAKSSKRLDELPGFIEGLSIEDFLDQLLGKGVAFITLPPSYSTGEPNISIYLKLLRRGISIITADKTALALSYTEIVETMKKFGSFLGFRATVAAGTPFVDLARGLRGRDLKKVKAVLNATTNFIISNIEEGMSWNGALDLARTEKLLEPDPSIDIEGFDAAAKLTIISNILGKRLRMNEVMRIPLSKVNENEIKGALKSGKRYKYIAELDFESGKATVSPQLLSLENPLSNIRGNYNGILIELEEKEKIYLEGPAGPAWRTARVMLTDLYEYLHFFIP
ncbi:MAG: homoserine dehydrogenase [Fervidicoccaceae archaeon]|jgi:homoserine dehydrogenase